MIRTLQLDLGTLDPPQYATGWYRDPNTGDYYYYNAEAKQWYIYSAGYLVPLSVPKESAPKVVDISPGDTLRIEYSYKYAGPAVTVTEYASIGATVAGIYDEKATKSKTRSLPQSTTPQTYSGYLDVVLPVNAGASWNDIECKVFNGGQELGLNYQNALNIVGIEAVFSEFAIVDYYRKV